VAPTELASPDPLPEAASFAPRYPKPSRLNLPVKFPGEKAEKAAEKLGIETVGELLDHIPRDRRAGAPGGS
jgi:ATP-dependent DNA helicase RecG